MILVIFENLCFTW